MTALTEFLFPAPATRATGAIIHWWETRRLPYNAAVGSAGICTLGVLHLFAALPPHPVTLKIPLQAVLAFAFCANVCYSFGPLIDVTLSRMFGARLLPVGPTLFRIGLSFSIGLALFPSLVMVFSYGYRIFRFLTG